jgi:2-keto-4-pentenoate hydratase/2-oxohepta-3-ene-1,7-dioic acid hydratase in catechol pathway
MKLITYKYHGSDHLGVLVNGSVINLRGAYERYLEGGKKFDRAIHAFPPDMLTFLQGGEDVLNVARQVIEYNQSMDAEPELKLASEEVVLQAPLSNVSKVIGIGLNYADHCREQNIPLPQSVLLFAKFPSSIIGPGECISWDPQVTEEVDYEAELAVVMGREASRVEPEDVWDYIAGYTIANDVSARDVQFADRQWVRGKSFDTFCPIGPYLVTRDEIADPDHLSIQTWLNGQLMQDSNTSEMVFKIPDIIAFINKSITLFPGDIICTGTPDGVGYFRDPKVFLKPGDIVEIKIERLGILKNPVK